MAAERHRHDPDEPVTGEILDSTLERFGAQITSQIGGQLEQLSADVDRRFRALSGGKGHHHGSPSDPDEDDDERLRRLAAKTGVPPEQLREAVEAAKREKLKHDLRRILDEEPELIAPAWGACVEIYLDEDDDEDGDKDRKTKKSGDGSKAKQAGGSAAKQPRDTAPGSDDNEEHLHWSERRVRLW